MKRRANKLNRHIKRAFGRDDIEGLLSDAADILAAFSAVDSGTEAADMISRFPAFIEVVDKAYEEYEERLKMSERNIEISSRELNEAFRSVERLNASVNAMMDSLGQGFLFFDKQGVFSPVYSRACLDLLGSDPARRSLPEVLGLSAEQEGSFATWLAIAFSGSTALDFDELKKLLPEEFVNPEGTAVGLDYRPMSVTGTELSGVLMIATDLTDARALESTLAAMRSDARKIRDISRSRNEFQKFVMDMLSFIETCGGIDFGGLSDMGRVTLLRQLHTYKGIAATFALDMLAQTLHKIENAMCKQRTVQRQDDIMALIASVSEILNAEIAEARRIFGDDFMTRGQVVTIDADKVRALQALVVSGDREALTDFIDWQILSAPLSTAMAPFVRELYRVAEMQGKPQPEVTWRGGDIPVLPRDYDDVFASFIHIARNIMDHAVGTPSLRLIEGKPEAGRIHIAARVNEGMLVICIADDGGGISPALIRERLAAAGRPVGPEEDDHVVIQHVFDAEFSTRDEADMLSGRGIGLNVVKEEVIRAGGGLHVNSVPKEGTTMTIAVPYNRGR